MDSGKTGTAEAISKEETDSDVEKRHRDTAGEEEARADGESSVKTRTCGRVWDRQPMVSLGQRWGPSPGLRDDQRGETGWEVGGRFKMEEICVHLWLIHADLWQKPTQHCKAITLQLKINNFLKEQQKREIKQKSSRFPPCSLSPGMVWFSFSCMVWFSFSWHGSKEQVISPERSVGKGNAFCPLKYKPESRGWGATAAASGSPGTGCLGGCRRDAVSHQQQHLLPQDHWAPADRTQTCLSVNDDLRLLPSLALLWLPVTLSF